MTMERKSFDARASSARPAGRSESAEEQRALASGISSGAGRRSAREAADPHERESVTVRTAQVPRWRIRFLEHDDDDSQQGGDFHASGARGRMHPAEVADAVLTRRQHVLQIAPHELVRGKRAFLAVTQKVNIQWRLYCLVHNLEKIGHYGAMNN